MRNKILLGFAALTLGAAFGFSAVQADDNGAYCFQACLQEHYACITATPDKAALCWERRQRCMSDCGAFN